MSQLRPWKNSRQEIHHTWEFLKDIRKDNIVSLMNIVDQLSSAKILEKAHEIECLAIRLDMDHSAELNKGEAMGIMK